MKKMSYNSSSIHVINSDHVLTNLEKFLYMALNAISNILNLPWRRAFEIRYLNHPTQEVLEVRIASQGKISPNRFLSNEFWRMLNLDSVKSALGGELRALEIGCGTGRYGKLLIEKDSSVNYLGVDIATPPEWAPGVSTKARFIRTSYEEVNSYIENYNILFTQSAIEHFESDLNLFSKVANNRNKTKLPLIQIHVFPSAPCLRILLWHGIRQYNFRTINRIIKEAQPEARPILICLGGPATNNFHWNSITKFSIRKLHERMYTSKPNFSSSMAKAIKRDEVKRRPRSASFYVLLMQHNIGKRIQFEDFVSF